MRIFDTISWLVRPCVHDACSTVNAKSSHSQGIDMLESCIRMLVSGFMMRGCTPKPPDVRGMNSHDPRNLHFPKIVVDHFTQYNNYNSMNYSNQV